MFSRKLTSAEIALATSLFKDSINYSLVKVHDHVYVEFQPDNSGMTPNGEIFASKGAYRKDYGIEKPDFRAFFLHEMTHVWQYQNNILHVKTSAILETLYQFGDYDKAYFYTLSNEKGLIEYNIEQQASIVQDYYLVVKCGLNFSDRVQNGGTKEDKKNLLKRVMGDFITDPKMSVR